MTLRSAQTRSGSLAKAAANVLLGYALALLVQRLAFSAFGISTSLTTEASLALLG